MKAEASARMPRAVTDFRPRALSVRNTGSSGVLHGLRQCAHTFVRHVRIPTKSKVYKQVKTPRADKTRQTGHTLVAHLGKTQIQAFETGLACRHQQPLDEELETCVSNGIARYIECCEHGKDILTQ